MDLLDTIIKPTVLYSSEVWGPSLLEFYWAKTERVQLLMLRFIIRSKWTIPQPIIQAEFVVHPF